MSRSYRSHRSWFKFIPVFGFLSLIVSVLVPVSPARAHPLDTYLQASYITVAAHEVIVELDLTPGVLVAPTVLSEIDTDGNEQISEAESSAYVASLLKYVALAVDAQPLGLTITKIEMPSYLTLQAGYGTIRVFIQATLSDQISDTAVLTYSNAYAPTNSTYQVNAFIDSGNAITLGTQERDDKQQGMTLDVSFGDRATASTGSTQSSMDSSGVTGQARRLLVYFDSPTLSIWTLLLALGLAGMLGGVHALTPGHGKTLVAAYLVGSRGTVRHAALLGAIVTFTHTASVILIGLVALFASQYIVPSVLVPILEVISGSLVVLMGIRLIVQRWHAFRNREVAGHAHSHDHDHDHDHAHEHGLAHDHGDGHVHTHLPQAEGFKLGSLVTMGISGGLVPCPEALGIMIIAVGLNRIVFGLGLILAFSLGLAAVLIVIGILLVRSRAVVERFGGVSSRFSIGLPLGSAILVTVIGIGMTLGGLSPYLR